MSPLRLNGSTSGYSQLDAPAVAGDQTFTLPGTGGTLDRLNRAGNILQVVQGSTDTSVAVSTTTYTDTGLSLAITPTSATSKILLLIDQAFQAYRLSNQQGHGIRILRGSTIIHEPPANASGPFDFYLAVGGTTTSLSLYDRATLTVLDSPNTTSSVTYKTQGRPYTTDNSGDVEYQPVGTSVDSTSYITLIEVAA